MVAVTGGLSEGKRKRAGRGNGNRGGVADGAAGWRREWKGAGLLGLVAGETRLKVGVRRVREMERKGCRLGKKKMGVVDG